MNIIISACLIGEYCKYNGIIKTYAEVAKLVAAPHIRLIPACPEVLGGLAIPRDPAEQKGEKVVTDKGNDVTEAYRKGAEATLQLAMKHHCAYAVLKERSPSCGSGEIYDGTFTHTRIAGDGVTAAILKQHHIRVIGESDIQALQHLIDLADKS